MIHQHEPEILNTSFKTKPEDSKNKFLKLIAILENGETWSVDRFGRFFAGTLGLMFSLLGFIHSPYWLLFILPLYCSQIITSFTNNCKFENLFISLGLKQREELYHPDGTLKNNSGGN